jgi:hypothetical protein
LIDGEILTSRQISGLKTLFEVSVELVLFFFGKIGSQIANGFSGESRVGFGLVLGSRRSRSLGSERSSGYEGGSGLILEGFPRYGTVRYEVSLFSAVEASSFCNEPGTFFWGELLVYDFLSVDFGSAGLKSLSVFPLLLLEIS